MIDCYRQWLEFAGPAKFEESVTNLTGPSFKAETLTVLDLVQKNKIENDSNPTKEKILEYIINEGKSDGARNLTIDLSLSPVTLRLELSNKVKPNEIFSMPEHFAKLEIDEKQDDLIIIGGHIEHLYIKAPIKYHVQIISCCINHIHFNRSLGDEGTFNKYQGQPVPSVVIKNSWIGELHLMPKSVHHFNCKKSWICSIKFPPLASDNPFVGLVVFDKVKMPTSTRSGLLGLGGTQQFSFLRAHFEKLQNGPMAGFMRAKELASEREKEWGITKYFSLAYFIISNYGQNPGKALRWCLFFLAINFSILYCTDGVKVDSPKGTWQMELCEEGIFYEVGRAAILTIQTAIIPFAIFSTKASFKFKSLGVLVSNFPLTLFADGAFLFCVFAIRKRLKFS
ncbi:MAG: hypothetical protein IH886_11145 [Nitrospinae bacterium]|nr:hypothetical protein [Nitrospinota bacterium]